MSSFSFRNQTKLKFIKILEKKDFVPTHYMLSGDLKEHWSNFQVLTRRRNSVFGWFQQLRKYCDIIIILSDLFVLFLLYRPSVC